MSAVWWIDSTIDVKLANEHVGMWLWKARAGAASPMHVHSREEEQFLLIDGSVTFVLGDERHELAPGEMVQLPAGTPHGYVVTSETATVVGSVTPGGFESFFTRLGTPIQPGETDGPGPDMAKMGEVSGEFGVELLGPPPQV
jgi:quercetin dioxygenase-like cupin family protein